MAVKCANRCCTAARKGDEGKMFRLDLDLGLKSGGGERRTEYMWLCSDCAQRMHPRVAISGDTVQVRLSMNAPMPPAEPPASRLQTWVN